MSAYAVGLVQSATPGIRVDSTDKVSCWKKNMETLLYISKTTFLQVKSYSPLLPLMLWKNSVHLAPIDRDNRLLHTIVFCFFKVSSKEVWNTALNFLPLIPGVTFSCYK